VIVVFTIEPVTDGHNQLRSSADQRCWLCE